jgi:tripartite-type tricarboxylate transporter receptor subunit TctC
VHVPFKGGGEAIASALGGQTPVSFGALAPAVPLIKDGRLRALAVASKARSSVLPDVPTMAEAGYPEVEGESWFAVVVPAGTPGEIIASLNREIAKAVAAQEVTQRLAVLGYAAVLSSPEECAATFRAEAAKWTKVIRVSGTRGE